MLTHYTDYVPEEKYENPTPAHTLIVFGGSHIDNLVATKKPIKEAWIRFVSLEQVFVIYLPSLTFSTFDRIVTVFLAHNRVDSSGLKSITER